MDGTALGAYIPPYRKNRKARERREEGRKMKREMNPFDRVHLQAHSFFEMKCPLTLCNVKVLNVPPIPPSLCSLQY